MELYNQITRDASRHLEQFSEDFRDALNLAPVEPWAEVFGHRGVTPSLRTTYPIPLDSPGFKVLKDDIKFRRLFENSISLIGKKYVDGVEEFAEVIEAPDFIDFGGAPGRMAVEWNRLPNQLVSALLAQSTFAGPLLDLYRNKNTGEASTRRLFASDHPVNLIDATMGTFENRVQASSADVTDGTLVEWLIQHFANLRGPNGQVLGLTFAGGNFLIPPTRLSLFREAFEFDSLIRTVTRGTDGIAAAAVRNEYKGTVGYTIGSELGTTLDANGDFVGPQANYGNYVYAFAANAPPPWVAVGDASPQELMHDKTSSKYLNTLKVGVAYHGNMAAGAALPQGVVRIELTD